MDEDEVGVDPDFEKSVDGAQVMAALQQLHGNSGLIGALQQKLDGLVGLRSGFLEELHPRVRARVRALEKLQKASMQRDARRVLEEKRALDAKYAALYAPLYAERSEIVKGAREAEVEDEELKAEIGTSGSTTREAPTACRLWLIALKNHEEIAQVITERDEGALAHLVDVTTTKLEGEDEDGDELCGFKIDFHFEENEYFEDATHNEDVPHG